MKMENIEISKATRTDNLPERFLKDGAEILSNVTSEIYNLSISHGIFPNAGKFLKTLPINLQAYLVTITNFKNQ